MAMWALINKKTKAVCASKDGDVINLEIFPTLKIARLELTYVKDKDKYTIVKITGLKLSISMRKAIRSDR